MEQRTLTQRLRALSSSSDPVGGGYGDAALQRETENVRNAPASTGNDALNVAAFNLYQLVTEGVLDHATVDEALVAAAHPRRPMGEILATLDSAWKGAARAPRPASRLPSRDVLPIVRFAEAANGAVEETPDDESFSSRFITTAKLLTNPDPEWLIQDVLVKNSLAALYGQPGTMKSFLAIDWALSIVTGSYWMGHAVQKGPVIYCIAEGQSGAKKRIMAWMERNNIGVIKDDLLWYPYPGDLLNKRWVQDMAIEIDRTGAVLTCIDTLSRSIPGGDENDSKDMTQMIRHLDILREASQGVILPLHHTPKTGGTLRGHSSLYGAVDTAIETIRQPNNIVVHNEKQKDAAEFPDKTLWWETVGQSIVLTDKRQAEKLDYIEHNAGIVLQRMRWSFARTGATATLLAEAVTTMTKVELHEALNWLVERGNLEQAGQTFRVA